jgi:hypothetical protein
LLRLDGDEQGRVHLSGDLLEQRMHAILAEVKLVLEMRVQIPITK